MQVVAQFLGNHDPSGLVDLHSGIHEYHYTIKNTIYTALIGSLVTSHRCLLADNYLTFAHTFRMNKSGPAPDSICLGCDRSVPPEGYPHPPNIYFRPGFLADNLNNCEN